MADDKLPELTEEETKLALEAARKFKAAQGAAPRVFGAVPTVKVKSKNHEGGYYEVSYDDFLEGIHEVYEGPAVEPKAEPAPTPAEPPKK